MEYMEPDKVRKESNVYQTPRVQLGCGTLILIALIVIIFSGRDGRRLSREVESLHQKIDRLEKKIDALSAPTPAPVQSPTPTQ